MNMSLEEIKEQEGKLEFEQDKVRRELKNLTIHHHNALIDEAVEDLMAYQEEKGKLERMDLKLHLQELTTKIRGLYDK